MEKQGDFKETGEQLFYRGHTPRKKNKSGFSPSRQSMIFKTLDELKLPHHSFVLELGSGNREHLPFLFQKFKGIHYYGIHSAGIQEHKTSTDPALHINEDYAQFIPAGKDGKLDFANDFFDGCFTANTIYFWTDPMPYFKEIYRVLQPGAMFHLAFTEQKNGGSLPWTQVGFTFYDKNEVKVFFRETGFENIEVKQLTEEIIGKDGKIVPRPFVLVNARK